MEEKSYGREMKSVFCRWLHQLQEAPRGSRVTFRPISTRAICDYESRRPRSLVKTALLLLSSVIAFEGCIRLNPEALKAFDSAYDLCWKRGDVFVSLPLYEKAIQLEPNFADLWVEYTACLRRAGRLQRAAQAGWRAVELGPRIEGTWVNLGNVFMDAREWAAAMAAFHTAGTLSRGKRDTIHDYLNVGYRQWVNGQPALARITFEYAFRINPSDGRTILDIGILLASLGKREEGLREIERAIPLLQKQKDSQFLSYANSVLHEIKVRGGIEPPFEMGHSLQRLPKLFLPQLEGGEAVSLPIERSKALSLPIDTVVEKVYRVSPQDSFSLKVPESWNEKIERDPQKPSLQGSFSIVYVPATGPGFTFKFTPGPATGTVPEMKSSVIQDGEKLLPKAMDQQLDLMEVSSTTAHGYIVVLTGKSREDEPSVGGPYLHRIQGVVRTGPIDSVVVISTETREEGFVNQIVDALGSFLYKKWGAEQNP